MSQFPIHSPETAPEGSRPALEAVQRRFGFVPNLLGELAEAPAALKGYLALWESVEESSLSPVESQVVLLATSVENGCEYCVTAHSAIATSVGIDRDVLEAIREQRVAPDTRLEALRHFTSAVVRTRGTVSDADVEAFLSAGYTRAQVLEVLLGVAMKTLSNYTTHILDTPIDDAFEGHRWVAPAVSS